MRKLQGIIVPVATPLNPDESLDREALKRLIDFLLDSGVHGLFANGSMGGFAFHRDSMQAEIISAVAEIANGRCPVLAGISDTSLARVSDKLRTAEALAVDAVALLPPYYYVYSQNELRMFYLKIADAALKPVVVYDNPRLAHNGVSAATLECLALHDNIAGVKCSRADDESWRDLLARDFPRDRFSVICGAEKRMGDALRAGFDGLTGGFHNIVPDWATGIFSAASVGDWTRCFDLQEKLNRAYAIFEIAGGWRALEIALNYMGIARKTTVCPFDQPPIEEIRRQIESTLAAEGVRRPYPAMAPMAKAH